jgi:type I restriction enzyme S subunit
MEDLGIRQPSITVKQTSSLAEVYGGYTYFADGDVLLAKITPCFQNGKLGIARNLTNGVGFGSTEFFVLRCSDQIVPEYLFYFLSRESFIQNGVGRMGGAVGQQRVPPEYVAEQSLSLPPLAEQKRIVGVLDAAFAGIAAAMANAEKNLANARELFESHLNAVFTRKCDGWVETNLAAEIDLLTGFAFKSKQYTLSPNGIRLLRGDNIIQGRLRWEDVKRWPKAESSEFAKYELCASDVVVAMDRTWVKAGLKFASISKEDLPCLLVQRVARLRARERLDARYLLYLVGSAAFTRYVLSIQTGTGVPHISGPQIQAFNFNRPSVEQQAAIADTLDTLRAESRRLESVYRRKLQHLADLKQSILHKAFAGPGELTASDAEALSA